MQPVDPASSRDDTNLCIELGGDLAKVSRLLGAATDAILGGRGQRLVFDLGTNALEPALLGAFSRWIKRNEQHVRTRSRAMVFVIPSVWARLQWRLAHLLGAGPVPCAVVRTRMQADMWLASR
jgi:hypothetical protein